MFPPDIPERGAELLAGPFPGRDLLAASPVFRNEFTMLDVSAPANVHPPFSAVLVAIPAKLLGLRGSYLFAFAILSLMLAASAFMVLRELGMPHSGPLVVAVAGLLFGWHAAIAGIRSAHPGILLCFLVVLSWVLLRRGKPWQSGILIGIAACIQAYPAFILLYFLFRHRRAFVGACVTVCVITAAIVLTAAEGTFLEWWKSAGLISQQFIGVRRNLSLAGMTSYFMKGMGVSINPSWVGFVLLSALSAVLMLLMRPWKFAENTPKRIDIEISLFMTVMLLASPLCWTRYLPMLILPIVVLLKYWITEPPSWKQPAMLGALLLFTIPDLTLEWIHTALVRVIGFPLSWLLTSAITYSVIAIAVWLAAVQRGLAGERHAAH